MNTICRVGDLVMVSYALMLEDAPHLGKMFRVVGVERVGYLAGYELDGIPDLRFTGEQLTFIERGKTDV